MSYCRFSERSSVYVYHDINGMLRCCSCSLHGPEFYDTRTGILEHLQEHIDKGGRVPSDVIGALREEIRLFGDSIFGAEGNKR
jgi:hypothetical protein